MRVGNLLMCGLFAGPGRERASIASRHIGSALSINSATVTAKWHESYVKGNVESTGSESAATELQASLRAGPARGKVVKRQLVTVT